VAHIGLETILIAWKLMLGAVAFRMTALLIPGRPNQFIATLRLRNHRQQDAMGSVAILFAAFIGLNLRCLHRSLCFYSLVAAKSNHSDLASLNGQLEGYGSKKLRLTF
jgi:hypothetical protein